MAARQLSDANSEGNVLGQSASDPIAFFGKTPTSKISYATLTTGSTIATVENVVQALLTGLKRLGLQAES